MVTLLLWATTDVGPKRYMESTEELRSSLRTRLHSRLGDAADSILRMVDSGAGKDALALAVACQVIFGTDDDAVHDAAAIRLEKYHSDKTLSKAVGRILGETAVDAIVDLDRREDPRIAQSHLERADKLVDDLQCEEYSHRNQLSRAAYEERLKQFATCIQNAVASPSDDSIETCEKAQQYIAVHRIGKQRRNADQVSRTEMAVRLIRWLNHPLPETSSFGDQSTAYVKELSFVDWAREAICRGDSITELSNAYVKLNECVSQRQRDYAKAFAGGLADWSDVGSTDIGVFGVEHVLEHFVAKVVAQKNRALMIVLDGMSWAVCHELLEDIREDHWFESTLSDDARIPQPVIATVPSETRFSRTTLMSGELTEGSASTESRNFKQNDALLNVSNKTKPPVLFHKKELTDGARGPVSEELSKAILDEKQAIVGVVINAVDDRLANAQQIVDRWTINRINPLGGLLRLARDSGRVVVLASDHGHVWHQTDASHEPDTEGSRWRQDDGKPIDGETIIAGQRVVPADKIIVPWSEAIHYKRKQHGYHGGATPQEMVCPLVILTDKSSAYSGLTECAYPKPEWWSPAPIASPAEVAPVIRVTIPSGTPTLFDQLASEPEDTKQNASEVPSEIDVKPVSSGWIDSLLQSQAYKDQKAKIRRHPPADETVRASLEALASNGEIMTPVAFANAANVPVARLDGMIAKLQRLLNVDGFEIITMDRNENRVQLNVSKLQRQFDIE
ncbi:MAG TPA: BREX-2 system phosphatase PglZ [Planctomycetaceae bacterium]|nr:BREX-2 system phosphatase PglZ [Planctomycetaceae bacterium]